MKARDTRGLMVVALMGCAMVANASTVGPSNFNSMSAGMPLAVMGEGQVLEADLLAAANVELKDLASISGFTLNLFSSRNFSASGGTARSGPDSLPLVASKYYFNAAGTTFTPNRSAVGKVIAAGSVPLSAAGWLLLSGLATVGALARRRGGPPRPA